MKAMSVLLPIIEQVPCSVIGNGRMSIDTGKLTEWRDVCHPWDSRLMEGAWVLLAELVQSAPLFWRQGCCWAWKNGREEIWGWAMELVLGLRFLYSQFSIFEVNVSQCIKTHIRFPLMPLTLLPLGEKLIVSAFSSSFFSKTCERDGFLLVLFK